MFNIDKSLKKMIGSKNKLKPFNFSSKKIMPDIFSKNGGEMFWVRDIEKDKEGMNFNNLFAQVIRR